MLQEEYFVVESTNDSCSFSWDEPSGEFGTGKPVEFEQPLKFRLGEPISKNPEFLDYHEAPNPVISELIYNALVPLDLYGVQWVPARVRDTRSPFDKPKIYCLMNIWNHIKCLDTEKSELEYSRSGNTIFGIDKLVLNEDTLNIFDLRKRQIFHLAESVSTLIVHKTVRDAILSVKAKGIRFYNVTEWNSDIVFE